MANGFGTFAHSPKSMLDDAAAACADGNIHQSSRCMRLYAQFPVMQPHLSAPWS
jgi:hypothetical protein